MAKSGKSRQTTFGNVTANPVSDLTSDNPQCDAVVGFTPGGNPERCSNSAKVALMRPPSQLPEFYCGIHCKETWLEMANIESEP